MARIVRGVRVAALVVGGVASVVAATGCGSGGGGVAARARRESAAPARALGMTVWSAGYEGGEVGVYLRPTSAWSADRYMDTLPAVANLALQLARDHPRWGDIEVCEDAAYRAHDADHPFIPATRVTVKKGEAGRLPARFADGGEVLRAAVDPTFELMIEPAVANSDSYRRAVAQTIQPG